MNHIPSLFLSDKRISNDRRSSICRLARKSPSIITQGTLSGYTLEEQVFVYQIATSVLVSEENSFFRKQMDSLRCRIKSLLTERYWALLVKCSTPYYHRFSDLGSRDEFISEAYKGLERGLNTYDPQKAKCPIGGCKVMTWFQKQIDLRLKDFIGESGGHFKVHPRNLKWRTYLMGGYDNRPEYKIEFEEKYGLKTEEARAALYNRYRPMLNLTPMSLQECPCGDQAQATLQDRLSDVNYINTSQNVGSVISNYTSLSMEQRAMIADFSRHCKQEDFEVWLLVERDCYKQPEVMKLLGMTKQEVLNAYRRVQRIREDYQKSVEREEKCLDGNSSRVVSAPGYSRRGRPSRSNLMLMNLRSSFS